MQSLCMLQVWTGARPTYIYRKRKGSLHFSSDSFVSHAAECRPSVVGGSSVTLSDMRPGWPRTQGKGERSGMTNRELIEQLREARRQARQLEQTFDHLLEMAEAPQNDVHRWVDQSQSALGAKRHCAAVRRRLADGRDDAEIIGRSHRLRADAYAEERALIGQGRLARCAPNDAEEEAAYQAMRKRIDG